MRSCKLVAVSMVSCSWQLVACSIEFKSFASWCWLLPIPTDHHFTTQSGHHLNPGTPLQPIQPGQPASPACPASQPAQPASQHSQPASPISPASAGSQPASPQASKPAARQPASQQASKPTSTRLKRGPDFGSGNGKSFKKVLFYEIICQLPGQNPADHSIKYSSFLLKLLAFVIQRIYP